MNQRHFLVVFLLSLSLPTLASPACGDALKSLEITHSSYEQIVSVMNRNLYDQDHLPIIPIQIFKWIGKRLTFFVGQRSREILQDKRDYRETPAEKPIHPMGIGLTGEMNMSPSR